MTELEARSLAIDIDHTLCSSAGVDTYGSSDPIQGAREALEQLRCEGWTIVLHTARHFNHWKTTEDWLKRHGFQYDQIVYGKPPARFYIDDRAITFDGDWEKVSASLSKIKF